MIVYEQPLNERIRLFLRLEHLFQGIRAALPGKEVRQCRTVVDHLLDLIDLFSRGDVKTELVKELERLAASLTCLEDNPEVDNRRLQAILDKMDQIIDGLHSSEQPAASPALAIELLSGLRRRHQVPAGKSPFDQPAYYYWLNQPAQTRQADLQRWLEPFERYRAGMQLALQLVRESQVPAETVAQKGFYQQALESAQPGQLLRVSLQPELAVYPEISAGKHRFSVRFMEFSLQGKARQCEDDVVFQLTCAGL